MTMNDMSQFHTCLREAKTVTALAGAGLSAGSGLATFRGAGGLWRTYDAMSLATPRAFADNPSRSWAFYEYRRRKAIAAELNPGHLALARFAEPDARKTCAPACKDFALITQNVDGLSRRAQQSSDAKDVKILEMHGSILHPFCTSCKRKEVYAQDAPIVPALADIVETVDRKGPEVDIPVEQLPRCKHCKSLMRPGVVWFGETPRHLDEISEILQRTDLLLVIGTSSTVYPAAGFASVVSDAGGKVAVFNLERSEGDEEADFVFYGPSEDTLPQALGFR